ncbi:MAG: hypothetical protein IT376_01725 [Polyangiaceae bacterium]|nr:hypothetical protein [Polyangiaceae bacterium]
MKRAPRPTRKERRAQRGPAAAASATVHGDHGHIHCVACGRHISADELASSPPTATWLTCDHGGHFASCTTCMVQSQMLIATHERTGQPVRSAPARH